jgi:CBS-domain-containing membrane protein
MLVKNWMSEPAITIEADSFLKDAIWLLKQHRISMCPVMKFGLLVGIVTDRDLKRVSFLFCGTMVAGLAAFSARREKLRQDFSRCISMPMGLIRYGSRQAQEIQTLSIDS